MEQEQKSSFGSAVVRSALTRLQQPHHGSRSAVNDCLAELAVCFPGPSHVNL